MKKQSNMADPNQFAKDVAVEVVKTFAIELFKFLGRKTKDFHYKNAIEVGNAYIPYLEKIYSDYTSIKTFLNPKTPVPVEKVFVNTGLKHKETIITTEKVGSLLRLGRKAIITGTGGIGKTTLLRHYLLNIFEETDNIPIFVELRKITLEGNIDAQIYRIMTERGFQLEEEYFRYSLELGKYVFLLDGYDEIEADLRSQIGDNIRRFSNRFSNNFFIITSRPQYEQFLAWEDFIEYDALRMTEEQAVELIEKSQYDNTEVKTRFLGELKKNLYKKYKSFASIPLLLIIMLLTYEDNAHLPDNLSEFYDTALRTLYCKHDASKSGQVKRTKYQMSYNDFVRVFSRFCFITFWKSEYEFSETRLSELIKQSLTKEGVCTINEDAYSEFLVGSVCMLIKEGLSYHFAHRSFQDYYAATFVSKLNDAQLAQIGEEYTQRNRFDLVLGEFFASLFFLIPDRFIEFVIVPQIELIKKEISKYPSREIGIMLLSGSSVEITGSYNDIEVIGWSGEILYRKWNVLLRFIYFDMCLAGEGRQRSSYMIGDERSGIKQLVDTFEPDPLFSKRLSDRNSGKFRVSIVDIPQLPIKKQQILANVLYRHHLYYEFAIKYIEEWQAKKKERQDASDDFFEKL